MKLTNHDLQKIYDRAKSTYLDAHLPEYEAHLYTVWCTIKAFCELHGGPPQQPARADWSAWMHDTEDPPAKKESENG